ncbi:MAG TPA: DUF374 domain-containing protein, partial [Pirellulaceae bacterium]|nr:DUF374 domain-containing protein [Pirellulaceae bacterium]
MKLRSPWIVPLAALFAAIVIRLWLCTLRIRSVSVDGRQHPIDPATLKCIYAFWHEGMLALLSAKAKGRVLVSKSADGEFIAQVCGFLGIGVVRGSSSRGGHWSVAGQRGGFEALSEMIRS